MASKADKRSVHTDALETLGTIIDETAKRDAIHIAVEACVAGETLYPGQHIGIVNGVAKASAPEKLGIVDPFINGSVMTGNRFWLLVYPRQITSLRHVWDHPKFPESEKKTEVREVIKEVIKEVVVYKDKEKTLTFEQQRSEDWIRGYAVELGISFEDLMEGADAHLRHGDYLVKGGTLEGEYTKDEFWDHYEVLTGTTVKERGNFFSCSC